MTARRFLSRVAQVLGRRPTAALAAILGFALLLVACALIVVCVMSMGGGLVIGYVAAVAAFLFTLGSWIITRTIQWTRATSRVT